MSNDKHKRSPRGELKCENSFKKRVAVNGQYAKTLVVLQFFHLKL